MASSSTGPVMNEKNIVIFKMELSSLFHKARKYIQYAIFMNFFPCLRVQEEEDEEEEEQGDDDGSTPCPLHQHLSHSRYHKGVLNWDINLD